MSKYFFRLNNYKLLYVIACIAIILIFSIKTTWTQTPTDTMPCDWRDKSSLEDCLAQEFPAGSSIYALEEALKSNGFIRSYSKPEENFIYYFRSSNDLSGYKVAVVIYTNNNLVDKIYVR